MPKFIIVGAGTGGLFSARALIKAGIPAYNITLLEKEFVVGGKCHTFKDPNNLGLKTEYGATLVAHNYGVVLDTIFEKKLSLEKPVATKLSSLAFVERFKKLGPAGKINYLVTFVKEFIRFTWLVRQYKHARNNNQTIPPEFELPFYEFAQQKELTQLNELLRPLVTGFGYGAMQTCPTFAVIEYIGFTTLAGIFPALFGRGSFYAIHGGFQTLMEAIASDFQVIKEVEITKIDRNNHIRVDYTQHGIPQQIIGDYLILAVSPLQWSTLGIVQLTEIEKLCIAGLTYYRYPVTVCKIKGYRAQHEFFEKGLQPEGFGKLALITTHDNRQNPVDGRLCTAYVNLKPGETSYDISKNDDLAAQLSSLPGVTGVEILSHKIWEDYHSFLSLDLRRALESQQFAEGTHTGYVNSCLSFEDVACIATQATILISNHFSDQKNKIYNESIWKDLIRLSRLLFSTPRLPPMSD